MSGQHPFAPGWDPDKSALAKAGRDLDDAIFAAERYGEDLVFEPELADRRGPDRPPAGTLLLEVSGDHVPFLRTTNPVDAFRAARALHAAGELVGIELIEAV